MDVDHLVKQLNSVLEVVNSVPKLREDKVKIRRNRILKLKKEGFTEKQIAYKLNCSLSTIEKDVRALRNGILPPHRTITFHTARRG